MSQAFNLTAQINLRGPANVRTVVADIRRQIGTINANINFRLDPNSTRNVTQLNANLRTLNATFGTTATAANNAANALRNFGNAVNNINARNLPQTLNSAAAATARLNQQASQASRSLQQAHSEMQEFGKQSGLAIRRFAAFSTVTGVIYGLTNAINQGVRAYIEYDRQLVKLQQVTGQSAKGLSSLESSITNLSTKLGVASSDLTEIASTLAQAGLSAKDTERAMKALALSSLAPSFDSMNETVEGSIALMRQFGIGAGELEKALGSVNSVAAKFAVESADIITAIQRTGGVFAAASKGVSEGTDALNEFIAVFTSVRATTRESAETIATGLRTIFTRIQRGSTIDALKEYGVNLQDLDGKFVGAYKAVELLSKGLSKLDPRDIKFSQIVEELGGFRQIGKVIPLIQQFATAQDALKVAQKGQGSLAADAAKAQESLAVQIVKVREEFLALFREIGKSDSFQAIAKGALDVTSALIKAADSVKGILPVLGVLFAFKGASALTQFTRGFTGGVRGGAARTAQTQAPAGRGFASGGLVPGSGDGDTVPAMLTPGEFVIRKKAVAAIGAQNLHNMNKYASGGMVTIKQLKGTGSRGYGKKTIERYQKENPNIEDDDYINVSSAIVREQMPLSVRDFAGNLPDLSKKDTLLRKQKSYDAQIGNIAENLLIKKLGVKKYQGAGTKGSNPSNAPIDLIDDNNLYEVKFKNEATSDAELYSKLLRYKLEQQPASILQQFKENLVNQRDSIFLGSIKLLEAGDLRAKVDAQYRPKNIGKNLGGLIQKFSIGGEAESLEKLGRSKLIELAKKAKIGYDWELLGKRSLTPEERSVKDGFLKQLVGAGILAKNKAARMSSLASSRSVAVVGITGDRSSSEVVSPGATDADSGMSVRGVPMTLETGALPAGVAKRVQARIRNGVERLVASVGSQIASAAGTNANLDRKFIRSVSSKDIEDIAGSIFEKAIGVANSSYDPSAKAIDFPTGLNSKLAGLFGVSSGVMTDVTNNAVTGTAKRKLASGQFDRGRLESRTKSGYSQFASGGEVGDKIITRGTIKYKLSDIIKAGLTEAEFMEQIPAPGSVFPQWKIGGDGPEAKPFPRFLQPYTEPSKFEQEIAKAQAAKMERISGLMDKRGRTMRDYEGRSNDEKLFRKARGFSSGGSAEDTVPALLTPGEFVINKKAAQRLGSAKLHQLNNADKIQGFNKGGVVQRFASGGPTLEARPQNANLDTLRVSDDVVNTLKNISTALQELGVSASSSSKLLERQGDINYRQVQRTIEADIRRMRTAGATAEQISAAENRLTEIRRQGTAAIAANRRFNGVNGNQLQQIETEAQRRKSLLTQRAMANGRTQEEINDPEYQERLTNISYRQATRAVTGNNAGRGVSGNSIEQYIRQSMLDRRTLAQMDRQYIAQRRQEILAQINAERGMTNNRREMLRRTEEAARLAIQETKERRDILNAVAQSRGITGPGGMGLRNQYTGVGTLGGAFGGLGDRIGAGLRNPMRSAGRILSGLGNSLNGQGGFFLSSALGLVAGQGNSIAGFMGKTGKNKASTGAAIESGIGTAAAGIALTSQIAPLLAPLLGPAAPFALGLGLAATAISAWTNSVEASKEAAREFEQNLRTKGIEEAQDKLEKSFNELEKDPKNLAKQFKVSENLLKTSSLQSADAAAKNKDIKDRFADKEGFFTSVGDNFFSNFGYDRAGDRKTQQMQALTEQDKLNAKSAEAGAEATKRFIDGLINSGKSLEEIGKDPRFSSWIESIAQADQGYQTAKRSLNSNTQAIIKERTGREILNDAYRINLDKTRQATEAAEKASKAGYKLAISLEKLSNTFNQTLGRIKFESDQRSDATNRAFEASFGKVSVADRSSRDLNVLQNPGAYNQETRQSTYDRVAKGIAGNTDDAKLISSVLSSDTQAIADKIEAGLKETLQKDAKKGQDFQALGRTATSKLEENMVGLPEIMKEQLRAKLNDIIKNIDKNEPADKKAEAFNERVQKELGQEGVAAKQSIDKMAESFASFTNDEWSKFIRATNQATEAQLKSKDYAQKARQVREDASIALREARSGASIGLAERGVRFGRDIADLTGGTIDPRQISKNIEDLKQKIEQQETIKNNPESTKAEIATATAKITNFNIQVIRNSSALEKLANSTELAEAAMQQLQNAQKLQADRLANVDKLLTSTPEELEDLNQSFIRLQQRLNGVNPNPSKAAQQAYLKTLRETGGNVYLAQRTGYGQMAKDRATDLQNMEQYRSAAVLHMTNSGQAQNQEEANKIFDTFAQKLREQFANESGLSMMPFVNHTIGAITDPSRDRLYGEAEMARKAAGDIQSEALKVEAERSAAAAARLLADSFKGLTTSIDQFQTDMKNNRLGDLGIKVGKREAKAIGGIVGAASGGVLTKVSDGEAYISPEQAQNIGYNRLHQLNRADTNGMKNMAVGGGVGIFKGPGTGTSDSIGPLELPEGSFIVRNKAVKALGWDSRYSGGVVGFAKGGKLRSRKDINRDIANIDAAVKNDRDAFFYTMGNKVFTAYGLNGMGSTKPNEYGENIDTKNDWTYLMGQEYAVNQMGDEWKKLDAKQQYEIAKEHKKYFDSKISGMSKEAEEARKEGKQGKYGMDFSWSDTETYKKEKADAENRLKTAYDTKQRLQKETSIEYEYPLGFEDLLSTPPSPVQQNPVKENAQTAASSVRPKPLSTENIYKEAHRRGLSLKQVREERKAQVEANRLARKAAYEAKKGVAVRPDGMPIGETKAFTQRRKNTELSKDEQEHKRIMALVKKEEKATKAYNSGDYRPSLQLTDKEKDTLEDYRQRQRVSARETLTKENEAKRLKEITEQEQLKKEKELTELKALAEAKRLKEESDSLDKQKRADNLQWWADQKKKNEASLQAATDRVAKNEANERRYHTAKINDIYKDKQRNKTIEQSAGVPLDPRLKSELVAQRVLNPKASNEELLELANARREREKHNEKVFANLDATAAAKAAFQESLSKNWIDSDYAHIRALGYLGGVSQGIGEAAYGAANVVAGAGISGAGRTYQAGAYLLGSKEHQAAGQAFAQVGEQAVAQGAYTSVELGQAIAGRGPIQKGDKTWLHKGDDERVQQAGPYGGATRVFQNIGYTTSQLAPAVASMGASSGTTGLGKIPQLIAKADDLVTSPIQALQTAGKGISNLLSRAGKEADFSLFTKPGAFVKEAYEGVSDFVKDISRFNLKRGAATGAVRFADETFPNIGPVVRGSVDPEKNPLLKAVVEAQKDWKTAGTGVRKAPPNPTEAATQATSQIAETSSVKASSISSSKPRMTLDQHRQAVAEHNANLRNATQQDLKPPVAQNIIPDSSSAISRMTVSPLDNAIYRQLKVDEIIDKLKSGNKLDSLGKLRRSIFGMSAKETKKLARLQKKADIAAENVKWALIKSLSESDQKLLYSLPTKEQDKVFDFLKSTRRDLLDPSQIGYTNELLNNIHKSARKPAMNSDSSIGFGAGATQDLVEKVGTRQQALADRLSQYTSSKDATKDLKRDNIFDINSVEVHDSLSARNVGGDAARSAGAAYSPASRAVKIKSSELKSKSIDALIDHELGHAFQHNTINGLKKASGSNALVYEKKLIDSLGSDIHNFLSDPKGYKSLRDMLSKDPSVGSLYSANRIEKEPVELFTSLVQASAGKKFRKNKQAVEMLKKLMKFHGYAQGGIVYANNGALIQAKPRGKDNIPAMLSEGEFVINRDSARNHMPLLHAVNSGHMNHGGIVKYMAQGGPVGTQYYKSGGSVSTGRSGAIDMSGLSDMMQGIKEAFGSLENLKTVGETIKSAASTMMNSASAYSEAANNMPNQLTANVTNDTRVHHMGLDSITGNLEQNIYQNTKKDSQQINHNSLANLDRKLEGGLGYMG